MVLERKSADTLKVNHTAPLKDVWEKLVTEQLPILFVVNNQGGLYGVLTKGDLSKGANGGKSSNDDGLDPFSAGALCNRNPKSILATAADEDILALMDTRVRLIPLIDEQGKLVSVAQSNADES